MPDVPTDFAANPEPSAPEAAAPVADNPSGPAAVATEPSSTPSPSTPANVPADEPKFEIKVDGKTELLTRAEMTALAQQGKSYTQKSQKLADEQRRWEADRAAILQGEKDNWFREQQQERARAAAEAAKDPATKALERVESLEQSLEDQRLESVMKPFLDKHNVDEQQFLVEASRQGLRTSADVAKYGEAIAKALAESQNGRFESRFKETLSKGEHPELKALLAKQLADYLAKKGNPGPSPLAPSTVPLVPGAPKKIKSFDEAYDVANEQMTGETPR